MGAFGEHVKPSIAGRSRIVFDPRMGIHRQVVAGQDIPEDLRKPYEEAEAGEKKPHAKAKPSAEAKSE